MITRLFVPSLSVQSVVDIRIDDLIARDIGFLLLDLDNTLAPWQRIEVPEDVVRWLNQARARGMKLCITSNTRNTRRLNEIADRLGVPCLCRSLKPRKRAFARSMALIGADPRRTAVIGDQLLTDIFGGNRAGLYTVLVAPMHPREFVGTKVSRLFERALLQWLRWRGMMGTKQAAPQSEREERA